MLVSSALPALHAQTCPVDHPKFEVASIRPSPPDRAVSNLNIRDGSFNTDNIRLDFLLQFAYGFPSHSGSFLVGAPPWLRSEGFDITANEDEALVSRLKDLLRSENQACLRSMIQDLLRDRFSLQSHFETRSMTVLALQVSKHGLKMQPAKVEPARDGSGESAADRWSGLHNDGQGKAEGRGATTPMIAEFVGNQSESSDRIVEDKTNLKGSYDFTLRWSPDQGSTARDGTDAAEPSLFTALDEQLGLKLTPQPEAVRVLVIDHVERPSEN